MMGRFECSLDLYCICFSKCNLFITIVGTIVFHSLRHLMVHQWIVHHAIYEGPELLSFTWAIHKYKIFLKQWNNCVANLGFQSDILGNQFRRPPNSKDEHHYWVWQLLQFSSSIPESEQCAAYTFYVTVVTYHTNCDQCNGLMNNTFTPKEGEIFAHPQNGSKMIVIDIHGNYIRKPTRFIPLRSRYVYSVTNKRIQCWQ